LPKVSGILRSNLAYEFVAVGVVWVVVAVGLGLALVLWPALTCLVAGLLLKFLPSERITWPWVTSSAILGFLVSAYQVYLALPFVGSTFSMVAIEALAGFAFFALAHLLLLYSGYSPTVKPVENM
jgi:hypothetical protein